MRFLEARDKYGKLVYLTKERWIHITTEHPEVSPYLQELGEILANPVKIASYDHDPKIKYCYKYYKHRPGAAKYILIIINYLNGEGFIITAYFVRNIQ
jgi:hypothetical protein